MKKSFRKGCLIEIKCLSLIKKERDMKKEAKGVVLVVGLVAGLILAAFGNAFGFGIVAGIALAYETL